MSAARISVVVPTLGRADAVARCVDALLDGTTAPAELVVVDQSGSGDIAKLLDARKRGRRLPVIRHVVKPPEGLSSARNAGARAARGEIVAFTDDDCVPDAGWLRAVVSVFGAEPPAAAVTGPMLPLDAADADAVAVSSRTSVVRRSFSGHVLPWEIGTGGNTAVRREWFESVGGYDERLGVGTPARAGEDLDLFRRLLHAGGVIVYEPTAVCRHERKSRTERLARRYAYGVGAGAALGRWFRDGDAWALVAAAHWCSLRMRLAVRNFEGAPAPADEARVLAGTVSGFARGLALRAWHSGAPTSRRSSTPGDVA